MMFTKKQKRKKPTSLPKEGKNKSFIQPKLNFGDKGDKYEVEADKMADQVVNNKGSENAVQKKEGEEEVQQKPLASQISPLIQKMETSEEEPVQKMEEKEPIQKMEEEESVQKKEEEEPVQTKSNKNISNPKSIDGKLRNGSGGTKMDNQTKNEMESGFGVDFSKVNIHNDNEAAQMSQDIGAQAFTNGNDVYFNKDKYNPNSKEGKHLLAHELTHTIQQKGMVQKKIQKQVVSYTCSAKAKRGVRSATFRIDGTTDAPDGTRVTFHYAGSSSCDSSLRSLPPFAATIVINGKFTFRSTSLLTTIPAIGRTFIGVVGSSQCCIRVLAM